MTEAGRPLRAAEATAPFVESIDDKSPATSLLTTAERCGDGLTVRRLDCRIARPARPMITSTPVKAHPAINPRSRSAQRVTRPPAPARSTRQPLNPATL